MNCEECKEQVFELIEREAADPAGVREVLERCPDCRAAFDEMKAALALAEQLPLEEPPTAVDAAILRAAAERKPRVVPLRKRRLQPPPWAMAAVAVLAVGIGVWTIPREVHFDGDVAPADKQNAERVILAEEMAAETPEEDAKLDDRIAEPAADAPVLAPAPRAEFAEAEEQKPSPEPARAKRRSRSSADESRAGRAGQAPASLPAANVAAEGGTQAQSSEVAAKASTPRKQERDDDEARAACKRKVDAIERRVRGGKDDAPTPEEELAIGKCYQKLENVAEARKWLERAAAHSKTKALAEKALRELAPD